MPEVRLIDANEFKRIVAGCVFETPKGIRIKAEIAIDARPAVDAEPVRHGRWAKAANKQYCTECRAVTKVRNAPFCWHCGAKIDLRTPTEVALDIADSVMMGDADNG